MQEFKSLRGNFAEWSNLVAHQAHILKVGGSNPLSATTKVAAKRLQRCAEHRRSLGGAIPMYGLALHKGRRNRRDSPPLVEVGPETGRHKGSGLIYTGVAQLGQSTGFQTRVPWVQILPSVLFIPR